MFVNNTEEQLLALMKDNEALLTAFSQYKEELSFFLSHMTHDIKNSLTLMNSSLQMMEKRQAALTESPYWNSVKEDMRDLFSLLDQLRTLHYGDQLNPTPTDVSKLLMNINANFNAFTSEKNVRLTLTLADNCHPYIEHWPCDPVKLKEALVNLIKNAIEATEENGLVSIVCSFFLPHLSIAITNTGATLEPEELKKIFTPFYTTKSGGTGLGLPTVHKIIAAHKGQLKVDSMDHKTTFTVILPIEK